MVMSLKPEDLLRIRCRLSRESTYVGGAGLGTDSETLRKTPEDLLWDEWMEAAETRNGPKCRRVFRQLLLMQAEKRRAWRESVRMA